MRFSDIKGLTWGKLQKDNSGNTFINYVQKKADKQEYLSIGKEAVKYLPKRDEAKDDDPVFNFPSGGYVNMQLRQWAFSVGIKKKVSFHVSRHTFATTVTLENGVALETVQKMLGHKTIRTTQIYAKMTKRRIGADMSNLAAVLGQGMQPAVQ